MSITRFVVRDLKTNTYNSGNNYTVYMDAEVDVYHIPSGSSREQKWLVNEIHAVGRGYSESSALMDCQFRFDQELENLKQERYANYYCPTYSSSSYTGYSSSSSSSRKKYRGFKHEWLFNIVLCGWFFIALQITMAMFPDFPGGWVGLIFLLYTPFWLIFMPGLAVLAIFWPQQ
ncbi:MAG: hypothetical protein F6K62_00275 [Sphaerospermopsis sp. SIO1G2]|nr:hypothetical protein [Sphaerospermopsis sp. SIO1G2]